MTEATTADLREYEAAAQSSGTFGRVICRAREHIFIVDGPVWNGCPGEALTPGELFLAGVAACGVELVEVFAREEGLAVEDVSVDASATVDPANQPRPDVTLFSTVRISYTVRGVGQPDAEHLVERVKARCPLYGCVAVATPDHRVEVIAVP